jgi:branched-subunit amino acid transport protein
MSSSEILVATIGMATVVFLCRASFFLPKEDLPMPNWLRRGLHYAPVAALAAVVTPEILMTQGHLIRTWHDARLFGAAVGLACYAWSQSLFWTIVSGTTVMLLLRAFLGW